MCNVFDAYANYYDIFYRDKDYANEAEYVVSHIRKRRPQARKVLELGCGTGTHAEHLARLGFSVTGVDMSQEMLDQAQKRKAALPHDIASRLCFEHGDIRDINIAGTFDAVIALFHVINYQTSNDDLIKTFETAARHLVPGGVFLFDFWYGAAVLALKPETRVKRFNDASTDIVRIAEPKLNADENVVEVGYTIFIQEKNTGHITQFNETHRMRYLFLPELLLMSASSVWDGIDFFSWLKYSPPSINDWSGLALLKRR